MFYHAFAPPIMTARRKGAPNAGRVTRVKVGRNATPRGVGTIVARRTIAARRPGRLHQRGAEIPGRLREKADDPTGTDPD
jgi:hypothetical protein